MTKRYIDKGYRLLHWATSIEVICPKCGGVGLIEGNPKYLEWQATFFCHSCSHTMKTGRDGWRGPIRGTGSQPCRSCGHKWVTVKKVFPSAWKVKSMSATTACPVCQSENNIPLEFARTEPSDHAIDPYFGLELALKQPTRHGLIWVYGAEHLHQLKEYIAARIRESSDEKWSYFNRLPTWIKTAKNRDMVLKALNKLEKRLIKQRSEK